MSSITSRNPATNEEIETYDLHTDSEVKDILDRCQDVYNTYRNTSYAQRASMMLKAADILEERKEKYAETMTKEMGKTYSSAIGEVEKCAWVCRYYAEKAEEFLADEVVDSDASKSLICYRPMGVVLAVMPWNYPFWQVFRFAAPALMAGNVGILKHSVHCI
jgi:succinate-semialdehyde dehydrogenase/glutarate-semialdehyde dehydrogenase